MLRLLFTTILFLALAKAEFSEAQPISSECTCLDLGQDGNYNHQCCSSERLPTDIADFARHALGGMLSIHTKNSAVQGTFFTDNYVENEPIDNVSFEDVHLRRDANIEDGDIHVIQGVKKEGPTNSRRVEFFRIPARSSNGFCNEMNAVEFGKNRDARCTLVIGNLEKDCETRLNMDRFTQTLSILRGKTSLTSVSYSAIQPSLLELEIASIKSTNGSKLDIGTTKTHWDGGTCFNALERMHIDVDFNDNEEITHIAANITVLNELSMNPGRNSVEQYFSVTFSPLVAVAAVPPRTNPGYQFGEPVLAAKVADDGSTIIPSRNFWEMKRCLDYPRAMVIKFRQASSIGCTISMTRSELQDLCSNSVHPYLEQPHSSSSPDLLVPKWMLQDLDMVGKLGNADPSDPNQWLPITKTATDQDSKVKSRIYNPTHGSCTGLITASKYRIHWTYTGSTTNPQAKIIWIEQSYEQDVEMRHRIDPQRKQKYSFRITVSFIFVESDVKPVSLPPPDIFSVPEDILFPFKFSSGTTISVSTTVKMAMSVALFSLSFRFA